VRTCIFLLCQEYFDMILVNNLSFYDGGVTVNFKHKMKSLKILFFPAGSIHVVLKAKQNLFFPAGSIQVVLKANAQFSYS
jgi:hypothetical protein